MKTCNACGEQRELAGFYKSKGSPDGHETKCKLCRNAQIKAYRAENIDRIRAHDRDRNQQQHRVAARHEYAESEAGRASARKTQRKFSELFPEKKSARNELNRAVRRGAVTPWPVCAIPECDCKPEAHHPDYSSPLDVVWLCDRHHKEAHKLGRELERNAA